MPVVGMNHFTVLADDLDTTQSFYESILGLTRGERPPLGFPGVWLYAAGSPVLHVVGGRALPAERRGVLDHMAFTATDLAGTLAALKARGVQYDLRRQPDTDAWQLFFFDPNGARVELDFAPSEVGPGACDIQGVPL